MSLLRRNDLFFGFILGSIFPLLAFAVNKWTDWGMLFSNKPAAFYVLAGLINLFVMRWYFRHDGENTGRGLIMITFIGALILIFTKTITV